MDLRHSEEDEQFRTELRSWLDQNLPADMRKPAFWKGMEYLRSTEREDGGIPFIEQKSSGGHSGPGNAGGNPGGDGGSESIVGRHGPDCPQRRRGDQTSPCAAR